MTPLNQNEIVDLSNSENNQGGVKFKEHENTWQPRETMPPMARFLIKYSGGLINNKRQAGYILLIITGIIIAISLFLLLNLENNLTPEETFSPDAEAPENQVKK